MPAPSTVTLSAFPHSPYARELEQGTEARRFTPGIEAEYCRSHLSSNRTLIRVACLLTVLLALRHVGEQVLTGAPTSLHLARVAFVLAMSVALAGIAWSPAFERFYLPLAKVIVPVRNVLIAVSVAAVSAAGRLDALMILPLMVLGPFFFLGLPYGVALSSVLAGLASFTISAALFDLGIPVILRAGVLLLTTTVACAIASRHLEKASRRSFLERALIAELAEHDALTGLKNRRVFDAQLERLWQRAVIEGRALALLLTDIDHFKAYNDCYGHQAGDQTLRRVAQALQSTVDGESDLLVRYGGEEFAAILYDVDGGAAEALAERMRAAVGGLAIEHRGAPGHGAVTISVGVAVVDPSRARRSRGALQLADQALYEAKVGGRDRVVVRDQAAHGMLVTGVFARAT